MTHKYCNETQIKEFLAHIPYLVNTKDNKSLYVLVFLFWLIAWSTFERLKSYMLFKVVWVFNWSKAWRRCLLNGVMTLPRTPLNKSWFLQTWQPLTNPDKNEVKNVELTRQFNEPLKEVWGKGEIREKQKGAITDWLCRLYFRGSIFGGPGLTLDWHLVSRQRARHATLVLLLCSTSKQIHLYFNILFYFILSSSIKEKRLRFVFWLLKMISCFYTCMSYTTSKSKRTLSQFLSVADVCPMVKPAETFSLGKRVQLLSNFMCKKCVQFLLILYKYYCPFKPCCERDFDRFHRKAGSPKFLVFHNCTSLSCLTHTNSVNVSINIFSTFSQRVAFGV